MEGLIKRLSSRRTTPYILERGAKVIDKLSDGRLPEPGEIWKYISLSGGFASINFIRWIARYERIEELTASTLRIGERQFRELERMQRAGSIGRVRLFVSTMMKQLDARQAKYDYCAHFEKACADNGWRVIVANNHSKIILMRTAANRYVLETSSNLNENPKIEQYSLTNDRELYEWYSGFFDALETARERGGHG